MQEDSLLPCNSSQPVLPATTAVNKEKVLLRVCDRRSPQAVALSEFFYPFSRHRESITSALVYSNDSNPKTITNKQERKSK